MAKLIKDKVAQLLTANPALRDSDKALAVTIWMQDITERGLDVHIFLPFLALFEGNVLTSYETIERSRRWIQERMPELRGTNYVERQEEEKVWIEEVMEDGDIVFNVEVNNEEE